MFLILNANREIDILVNLCFNRQGHKELNKNQLILNLAKCKTHFIDVSKLV